MAEESVGERFTRGRRRRMELSASFTDMETARVYQNLDYFQAGSRSRLRTVRRRLEREADRVAKEASTFYNEDLAEIYRAGRINGGMPADYKLTAADRRRLKPIRDSGLERSQAVTASAKREAANVNRFRRGSRRDARELGPNALRPKIGGRRRNSGDYHAQIIRTDAQRTFNFGVIDAAKENKIKALRVSDGPDCGLTEHRDPFKVNGELFSIEDAERYVMAHPNCSRTFEPVPGEPKPPSARKRKREFLTIPELIGEAFQNSKSQIELDLIGLALDLASDQQLRQLVFDQAMKSRATWIQFRQRINSFIARQGDGGPTEDEIFERMIDYIDNLAEGQQAPEWVYEILGTNDGQLIRTASEDFVEFNRLRVIGRATHAEVNMTNRIQNHYGDFFQARMSAANPNMADRLGEIYRGVRQHYNEPRYKTSRTTTSIPRLGGEAFRGPRFQWRSRPFRFQTTIVNNHRHMTREELRSAMLRQGLVPYISSTTGAGDLVTAMVRREMIDALGYNPGLLSHLTVNPQGAFRLGFRISPTGWIQPELRLVPKTIPLRYTTRLNRGRVVDGVRIRSVTQELRAVLGPNAGVDLPIKGRISLPAVGLSTNTIVGRLDTFDDLKRFAIRLGDRGNNLAETPLPQLRAQARFIAKGKGLNVEKLTKEELVELLDEFGAGLSGRELLMRNTELLSLFAELRLQGFNRFDIAKTMRISPEEAGQWLRAVQVRYGDAWRERSMRQFMHQAADQTMEALEAGGNYLFKNTANNIRYRYASTKLMLNNYTEWLGSYGSNTFAGRIYGDAIEGYQFVQDFKRGSFGSDLIEKYGPKLTDAKGKVVQNFQDIFDPNVEYDWAAVARTALMTPPQLANYMTDVATDIAATVGFKVRKGASVVKDLLDDPGPLREFFKEAVRRPDGTYRAGGLVFDSTSKARKGNGFYLIKGAKPDDQIRYALIRNDIATRIRQNALDTLARGERLRDSVIAAAENSFPDIVKRLDQFNEWFNVRISELAQDIDILGRQLLEGARSGLDNLASTVLREEDYNRLIEFLRDAEDRAQRGRSGSSRVPPGYRKPPEFSDPQETLRRRRATTTNATPSRNKIEDQIIELNDLQRPEIPLFTDEQRVGQISDDVYRVMAEHHSARRGGRSVGKRKMQYIFGEPERRGNLGHFAPKDNPEIFLQDRGRFSKISQQHVFIHEYGHYQDFDWRNRQYVSEAGDVLRKIIYQKHRGFGGYNSINGRGVISFDEMVDELGAINLKVQGKTVRVTEETKAQAKFSNAARSTSTVRSLFSQARQQGRGSLAFYSVDPAEIWARAYAQRIVQLDPSLRPLYRDLLQGPTGYNQWQNKEEFDALIPYIDNVLRQRGVLK